MPRRYVLSTNIPGSSPRADTEELSALLDRAASLSITSKSFCDELAERTGFDEAVRNWTTGKDMPNGFVRKIILSNARLILQDAGRS